MPGKVNPTQCEAMTMVCTQVMGNDATIGFAGSQGNFELNVYKPVMIHNLLESIELLGDACDSFRTKCIDGLELNKKRVDALMQESLMLVTALNPHKGYYLASKVAKHAHKNDLTLIQAVLELNVMTEAEFRAAVVPGDMVGPLGSIKKKPARMKPAKKANK